jgi:hypothetical protein
MKDLDIQTLRANALAEVLSDFVDVDEYLEDGERHYVAVVTVEAVLDALGCCGLVLEPGNDAGMAFMEIVAHRVTRR